MLGALGIKQLLRHHDRCSAVELVRYVEAYTKAQALNTDSAINRLILLFTGLLTSDEGVLLLASTTC